MSELVLPRSEVSRFETAAAKEWLVTNGIGGFASGTVSGANTRRYHGLLVAALRPPTERMLLLSKIDEEVEHHGVITPLSTNEFGDGSISPHGYQRIVSFSLCGGIPCWCFIVAGNVIQKRICLEHGTNRCVVEYTLLQGDPIRLHLRPLCAYRDYHHHHRGAQNYDVQVLSKGFKLNVERPYQVTISEGEVEPRAEWYWNFKHRVEQDRGLDCIEDLFVPGSFVVELRQGQSVTIDCSLADERTTNVRQVFALEEKRRKGLGSSFAKEAPWWISQLNLSADQFVVTRTMAKDKQGKNKQGTSLIAGYPWFTDWTRDTMLSLPGILLVPRRFNEAKNVLQTYAQYLNRGLLPNTFPDWGEQPEQYGSVDAPLLYIYAIDQYYQHTRDLSLVKQLFPVMTEILAWLIRGTRFNIHADPADGLLYAGDPGWQLTWMDAKVGNWVVTPRMGKPVEINALWHHAFVVSARFARLLKAPSDEKHFAAQAKRIQSSFEKAYWYQDGGYLYDVIGFPERSSVDAAIRPNQILATGLSSGLLDRGKARSVVDTVRKELLTPLGLRSLASSDPEYRPLYGGDQLQRDSSYHQGTVWPWLIGFFIASHLEVYKDPQAALSFLQGFPGHIFDAGLGSVSEIASGALPCEPKGCFAQAWSVGEVLRAWWLIEQQLRKGQDGEKSSAATKKKSRKKR